MNKEAAISSPPVAVASVLGYTLPEWKGRQ
jgi:hypothetical protein